MVSARCSVQLEKHLAPLAARPASTLPGRRHAHLTSPGQSVSTTVRPSAARSVLRNVACRRPAAHGAAGVGAGCGGACARVVHAEAQSTSTRGQRRAARAQGRMAGATAGRKRCGAARNGLVVTRDRLVQSAWRREAQLTYSSRGRRVQLPACAGRRAVPGGACPSKASQRLRRTGDCRPRGGARAVHAGREACLLAAAPARAFCCRQPRAEGLCEWGRPPPPPSLSALGAGASAARRGGGRCRGSARHTKGTTRLLLFGGLSLLSPRRAPPSREAGRRWRCA